MAMKRKLKISPIEITFVIIAVILLIILGIVLVCKFVVAPIDSQTEETENTSVVVEQKNMAVIPVATKEELLAEVNKRRAEVGVAPLQHSSELEATAQAKCDDMVARNYYNHVNPDGLQGVKIVEYELGWRGHYGENLMKEMTIDDSAGSVFQAWNDSPSHKDIILDNRYTLTGFGICGDLTPNDGLNPTYFVEHFYGPF